MKTLNPQVVLEKTARAPQLRTLLSRLQSGPFPIDTGGADGGFASVLCALIAAGEKGRVLIVLPTDMEAEALRNDLELFSKQVRLLPWWHTAAYRPVATRSHIFGERAAELARLASGEPGIVIASHRAAATPVPARNWFAKYLLKFAEGGLIDSAMISEKLSAYGYLRVPRISLPGEYAVRGEVLDIFPPGQELAYRIMFDFDKIEKISLFDPVLQSGSKRIGKALVYPMKELLWNTETLARLKSRMVTCNGCSDRAESMVSVLAEHGELRGEELWYPVAFESPVSVLDYLDPTDLVISLDHERLVAQEDAWRREFNGMYRSALREMPVPPPDQCLYSYIEAENSILRLLRSFSLKDSAASGRFLLDTEPARSYFGNIAYFKEELAGILRAGTEVYIFADTEVQAERLSTLIGQAKINIVIGSLSSGFALPAVNIRVVRESEIFGRRNRIPKSVRTARSVAIDTFIELAPGDFVVHINYGIGRFISIERMKVLGNERDYIKIEYADSETVFVPIEQANLVQRYIGNEGESPRLDRIGSKSWEARKAKVRKSVEELAERLIRIYARRRAAKGFSFPKDNDWQLEFEASFPYEETIDQLRCIDEVKIDMESPRPMDRLVCGDVGYGKTEIAMRACFKAAISSKQVAFLAPTTILAEQHFENLRERCEGFPVNIAMMSRLVDKRDQKVTLAALAEGKIDILVGTQRLLQKDIKFKDIGLLVIDEEQRFGVKDKEKLKEMKASVDCLTLTATPIPRTLHMSLLKIRDMSVLQTPPTNRQPIETIVEEFNPDLVASSIRQEIERGGQIFYLHNRVQDLEEVQSFIQKTVPEVLVEIAHGQMDGHELEDIMHRFIHGGFQVLVSTTIIENGIDIPNVNTIIIDRADMYGISQLYQLKGRVGRSDRLAYAYLFYPDRKALSELAMKRLQIISDFTELGSGFKIAMKDLEVRGAGNLLGREQSGDIYAVGFDLYLKLLDDAVATLSGEGGKQQEEPYLELEYAGYIPDTYINMPMVKMEIYKKLASISSSLELEALFQEMADRFGPLPDEVQSLLALAEIRILCRKLAISSLTERGGAVRVEFSKVATISVERLLRLMRESGGRIKLDPHSPNVLIIRAGNVGLREKSEFIRERLFSLVGGAA